MVLQLYQMASSQCFVGLPKPKQNFTQILTEKIRQCRSVRCVANSKVSQASNRFEIYQPTAWSHDYIESLDTKFPNDNNDKVKELDLLLALNIDYENDSVSTLQLLELIDNIEQLGLGYRFQTNIKRVLNKIASTSKVNVGREEEDDDSLHAVSLRFRLLRQHGYNVSQDFLRRFKDNDGEFMECLQRDVKGLLSLYEASYLSFADESDLHEANLFATKHLRKVKGHEHVNHALDLPLYRRMVRLQARWYIDAYGKRKDANRLLLELATFDFNMVQSLYKKDLQELSKWWKNLDLAKRLFFIRDRLMESFFWTIGVVFEPQYHYCRVGLTKVCVLITTIDDIYDVYGSLEELIAFTDAVKRWDIHAVKQMPEYLKLSFLALYNTINEMGYNTFISQGESSMAIFQEVWGELCEAFLVEAKWAHNGYMPTLEDYLDNAWRSVSGMVILTHGYILINEEIKTDVHQSLETCHDLLKWSSMIFRLCNDLGSSSDEIERGKTANAISCYMQENGVCEDVAREYITSLIDEAWRKMMNARVACSQEFTYPFIDMAINLARISHCTYQYGDGHTTPDARAKDRILSVIIEPMSMKERE